MSLTSTALELADEYNLRNWILVLLDPSPIESHPNTTHPVNSPPQYIVAATHRPKNQSEKIHMATSSAAPTPSTRKRSTRSQSPEKTAPTPRKIATPSTAKRGRGRPTNASKLAVTNEVNEEADSDEPVLSESGTAEPEAPRAVKAIRKSTEPMGTPSSSRRNEITQNVKHTIEQIKERSSDVVTQSGGGRKRKAREVEAEDDAIDAAIGNSTDAGPVTATQPSSKRIRVSELEVREQKLKTRALTGIVLSFLAG